MPTSVNDDQCHGFQDFDGKLRIINMTYKIIQILQKKTHNSKIFIFNFTFMTMC